MHNLCHDVRLSPKRRWPCRPFVVVAAAAAATAAGRMRTGACTGRSHPQLQRILSTTKTVFHLVWLIVDFKTLGVFRLAAVSPCGWSRNVVKFCGSLSVILSPIVSGCGCCVRGLERDATARICSARTHNGDRANEVTRIRFREPVVDGPVNESDTDAIHSKNSIWKYRTEFQLKLTEDSMRTARIEVVGVQRMSAVGR
jgi:hypothetical protein